MPRKKNPIPTNGTLNAVVVKLANENALLREKLDDAQSDLTDTLDRMLKNQRREKDDRTALERDLKLFLKEIDGKGDADLAWYVQKIRMMRTQLKRLRLEHEELEKAVAQQSTAGKENVKPVHEQAKEQVA